jgi:predicted nucleotidyltransferase
MAERLADQIDAERFGVIAVYLAGSARSASAGPASDIDLVVHLRPELPPELRRELETWLDGWSRALAEVNYLRTGVARERLLDLHWLGAAAEGGIETLPEGARRLALGGRRAS